MNLSDLAAELASRKLEFISVRNLGSKGWQANVRNFGASGWICGAGDTIEAAVADVLRIENSSLVADAPSKGPVAAVVEDPFA
jgi:hypothetical protein